MSATTFLVLIACLLLGAKCVGWLCQRVRLPAVLGQLLVGVVVGPSLLGWVHPEATLDTFATIGVIILMFIAGLETDMKQMRQVGGAAFLSATMGVILPFITAQTLKDLGKLQTREGTTILGAAVIDDVLGLIVLSVMLAFTLGQNPVWAIVKMLIYFPVAYVIGHYGFPRLSRWLPQYFAVEVSIGLVLAFVLLYAWSAELLGNVAAITGAYLAGILVSRTEMSTWVHDGFSKIGYALFVPLFFVYVGLESDLRIVASVPILLLLGFIGIAIATKVIGCGLGAFVCRFSAGEALTVGVGMISRGEVALITATIGLQAGLINSSVFSIVVLISLATTLVTPLLLKFVYLLRDRKNDVIPAPEPLLDVVGHIMHSQEDLQLQEESHEHV